MESKEMVDCLDWFYLLAVFGDATLAYELTKKKNHMVTLEQIFSW